MTGACLWVSALCLFFITQTRAATNIVASQSDSGPGSLRQTIIDASSGDTIAFGVTGIITLSSGELVIDKDLTLVGPGLTNLAISGNHAGRVFAVPSGVTALISGLTVCNGQAPNGADGTVFGMFFTTPGEPGESGGAIHNSGFLVLNDCRVASNSAGNGGNGTQIEGGGSPSAGGSGGSGGGIFNAGELVLSHCVVEGNHAGAGGVSGVFTYSPVSGAGGPGGGVCNVGLLRMEDSAFRGNAAGNGGDTPAESHGPSGGAGGGVWSSGTFMAVRSEFSGNMAGHGGHGGADSLDAGCGGSGGSGGGVVGLGQLSLTNCTVSGNAAGSGGGGGSGYYGQGGAGGNGGSGGGLYGDGVVSLISCTISGNSGGQGGSGGSGYGAIGPPVFAPDGLEGNGGGIYSEPGAGARFLNTMVASNTGASPDAHGAFSSLGHNLVTVTNGSSGFGNNGDKVGSIISPLNPGTGSLTDNGGPTLTMALLPGSPAIDAGDTASAPVTDQRGLPRPSGLAADIGAYEFQSVVHYVDLNSPDPQPPYTNWATAATNIQDAVDVAAVGEQVVVTNGLYAIGGRAAGTNLLLNRVVVNKPLSLKSVNGPQFTIIKGKKGAGSGGLGDDAIRCVYLTNGALLSGFTLTNGATRSWSQDYAQDQFGGGVMCDSGGVWCGDRWCGSETIVVSDCVIVNNSAYRGGGGSAGGTLNNCTLVGNWSGDGGGAYASVLNDCALSNNSAPGNIGGGAAYGTLTRCVLSHNSAGGGGGAYDSTLNDCILYQNRADQLIWPGPVGGTGGGAAGGTLNNCTIVGNSAYFGGGVSGGTLNNCVLRQNLALLWDNGEPGGPCGGEGDGTFFCTLNDCLLYWYDYTHSTNSIFTACWERDPLFVDYASGDLHLQSNSPCINAGNNAYVTSSTDLDGNPRIVGGTVDIGAYEFQSPVSLISYAWLQQYGLPTDGSLDGMDEDCDGLNTWQEWRCLTCPTNALSVLRVLSAFPDGSDVIVRWKSEAGVSYFLERTTNLVSPLFTTPASNIAGLTGTTVYTDTNAPTAQTIFYRVGVGD